MVVADGGGGVPPLRGEEPRQQGLGGHQGAVHVRGPDIDLGGTT